MLDLHFYVATVGTENAIRCLISRKKGSDRRIWCKLCLYRAVLCCAVLRCTRAHGKTSPVPCWLVPAVNPAGSFSEVSCLQFCEKLPRCTPSSNGVTVNFMKTLRPCFHSCGETSGPLSSGSARWNVDIMILQASFAVGRSSGMELRHDVIKSSITCGHSSGTWVLRRKPLRGVSCVAISHRTTPKLNMSTCMQTVRWV